jgi:hypothetical protein
MSNDPDFFLSAAGEMRGELSVLRSCWRKDRLRDGVRDDYMLVEIEPPISGQRYGLMDSDITKLILSTRLKGFSLFPITSWPCEVYVARILDRTVVQSRTFNREQVELIGWATIFRSPEQARAEFGNL